MYTGGAKFFKFVFKIDQSEMTKSHMFSTLLRFQSQIAHGKIVSEGKMLLMAKLPLPK